MKKKRGRKTSAVLAIITDSQGVELLPEKPRAPAHLTEDEAVVWYSVIDVHEQDWISSDQFPLLVQFCCHTMAAKKVAQLIQAELASDNFEWSTYKEMLAAQERESRAITALARTLRITNQARYVPDSASARPTVGGPDPWEKEK